MNLIKKHLSMNYSKGRAIKPQYIIIHETDNTAKGADAEAHYRYWNTNLVAQSSVHFVVDDKKAIQLLELNERAWHVGDNRGYSKITNDNSIGIEICVNSDGDYNKAYNNTIELVRYLIKTTGISHIVRHADASGKHCPRRIIDRELWLDFLSKCTLTVPVEVNTMDKNALIKELENLAVNINNSAFSYLKELDKLKETATKNCEMQVKTIKGIQEYIKNH